MSLTSCNNLYVFSFFASIIYAVGVDLNNECNVKLKENYNALKLEMNGDEVRRY